MALCSFRHLLSLLLTCRTCRKLVGHVSQAELCLDQMRQASVEPDHISFNTLISAGTSEILRGMAPFWSALIHPMIQFEENFDPLVDPCWSTCPGDWLDFIPTIAVLRRMNAAAILGVGQEMGMPWSKNGGANKTRSICTRKNTCFLFPIILESWAELFAPVNNLFFTPPHRLTPARADFVISAGHHSFRLFGFTCCRPMAPLA